MSKICKECNIDKSYSEYTKSKNVKDGYENKCKKCRREARKKHTVTCESCGEKFRTASKVTRFCSHRCMGRPRSKRIKMSCSYCDSVVEVKAYKAELHDNHYCDQDCRTEHLKTLMLGKRNPNYGRVDYNCDGCETELKIHPYRLEHQRYIFCSNDCYKENIGQYFSQENSSNWNSSLTYEERIIGRNYPEYENWRGSVFKRDDYTCQCCHDDTGGNLIGHHILNYSEHDHLRVDTDNGITLCEKCHIEYHNTYGYTKNNREQLNEFMNNYQNKQASM